MRLKSLFSSFILGLVIGGCVMLVFGPNINEQEIKWVDSTGTPVEFVSKYGEYWVHPTMVGDDTLVVHIEDFYTYKIEATSSYYTIAEPGHTSLGINNLYFNDSDEDKQLSIYMIVYEMELNSYDTTCFTKGECK